MPDILMPSLGADMDAGTLVEWKVAPGDRVERDTIVALVETQKATMEIEGFATGIVDALLVEPGTKVPVGAPLARLRATDEAVAAARAAAASVPVTPVAAAPAPVPATTPPAPLPPPARVVRSSPAARRAARERGIDLASIEPSGPGQAVVLRDIERAAAAAPAVPAAPPLAAPPAAVSTSLRAAVATAMSRSKREIPHFYLAQTISLRRALTWLEAANAKRPLPERLLPGALLHKAVVDAVGEVPELSGFWQDGAYRPVEAVHLGTAVSLRGGGVLAPAILDADGKSLDELMAALRDLVTRARAGRLRSAELSSATITVTNLGDRGCEAVWGVINPPQVAIVGFGAVVDRPWVEDGRLAVHPVVTATLSVDHRVCDGHRGGLFLSAIDHLLQQPERL
jgi:pyruvate dehydrogenase E2 component (dihydrolipoamide acetyltransferase)